MQRYNSQRRKDFQWEKLDEEAAQYDFTQAYQSGKYGCDIILCLKVFIERSLHDSKERMACYG